MNGGRSWESVGPPGTSELEFRDIEAFDARNAVTLSIGPGESSRIYRTFDGGKTWQESFRNTDANALYDCVAFFDRFRADRTYQLWVVGPGGPRSAGLVRDEPVVAEGLADAQVIALTVEPSGGSAAVAETGISGVIGDGLVDGVI